MCDTLGREWIPSDVKNATAGPCVNGTNTVISSGMECSGSCDAGLGSGASVEWTLVNGAIRPIIDLDEDVFKLLRFVYVSIKRYVNLIITDDPYSLRQTDKCEFQLIAKDGIYLNYAPREVKSIIMASGNRADVMVRCSEPGIYHLLSVPLEGTVYTINQQGLPNSTFTAAHTSAMGVNPVTQGFFAEIHVSKAGGSVVGSLPPFMPERPPMLQNTTDLDISRLAAEDPNFAFKDYDLFMSAQETAILEPSQLCFVNGGLFNDSQASYTTTLDSLNEFRITGVIQHPFHMHINSFQIYLDGRQTPDIYGGYFEDGDWHDTLFIPPRQGVLKAVPEIAYNQSTPIGVSDEQNREAYCSAQTGPDGQTPGRFADGTCCCPAVPMSGCGQECSAVTPNPETSALLACAALTGPNGLTPGRYEDGSCCCPAVPQSGCGQVCGRSNKVSAAELSLLEDPWADVMNATIRWWAMNYTGYAIWHCHFVNHEVRALVHLHPNDTCIYRIVCAQTCPG